jgi:hypothetical protein
MSWTAQLWASLALAELSVSDVALSAQRSLVLQRESAPELGTPAGTPGPAIEDLACPALTSAPAATDPKPPSRVNQASSAPNHRTCLT